MSSRTSLSSERDVALPDYSWQEAPSSPKVQRVELGILNSTNAMQYQVYKQIFNGSYRAPVSSQLTSGARVLFVNADDLEWVKDMSRTYPNSEFECVTLLECASTRPEDLPDKIKHYSWNIQEKLLYSDSLFDFVYVGTLLLFLRVDEWPVVLKELFRVIKPGGFLEVLENDIWAGNMGPTHEVFVTTILYSLRARDLNTRVGRQFKELLKNAGFTNIVKFHLSVPFGWGPPEGKAYMQLICKTRESMVPFLSKSLGWTKERLQEEFVKIDNECIELSTYCNIHKAYGQKP